MPAPRGTSCPGEPAAPIWQCHPGDRSHPEPPCCGHSAHALHFLWQAAESDPHETRVAEGSRASPGQAPLPPQSLERGERRLWCQVPQLPLPI